MPLTTTRSLTAEFAADVARDLALVPKQLQSNYLYDALGSSLFEAICRLPWYRITRSETELLARHAAAVVAARRDGSTMLVLLLGSNIGNFDQPAAAGFLNRIRATLDPDDLLLLGADLVKPERELLLAYDDPLGVTAAFNKNLLVRINRELGGEFDLARFDHQAVWNQASRRIEMHLVSRANQRVRIAAAGTDVAFAQGERIWTESSYKYEPDGILEMGVEAGFATREQWVDRTAGFALTLFGAI